MHSHGQRHWRKEVLDCCLLPWSLVGYPHFGPQSSRSALRSIPSQRFGQGAWTLETQIALSNKREPRRNHLEAIADDLAANIDAKYDV